MQPLESRRWFQCLVAGIGTALSLALALPIYFALPADAWARVAVPFLAAGAVSGFARLLTSSCRRRFSSSGRASSPRPSDPSIAC